MRSIYLFALCSFSFSSVSFSQWNSNPALNTAVSTQLYDQQDVRIVTDGKGGAIIIWLDFRNDPGQLYGDVYAQRLDKNGNPKWTTGGVPICLLSASQEAPAITEDGLGGAIISWNDWRNGTRDIYAQKIDSSGNVAWTANGVPVVMNGAHQQDSKLISDGTGGAIVVWQDSSLGNWDIYTQRLNSAGVQQWLANGEVICTATNSQINPRIESDGSNGAIIVWQDKRNGVDYDIYAQRITGSASKPWAVNGVVICNSISTQSNPKIEPDGSGGAIIAWQDKRNGIDYNVYAQRITSAGAVSWTTNGVPLCTSAASQSAVDMTSEGVSGAIVAWKDQRFGNFDVYAQRIDLAGNVQWAANGVAIASGTVNQLNPNTVGDGAGGAIIVWQDSSAAGNDVKSQRVNAAGSVLWTAGGVAVGTAANNQTSPKSVSDGGGGCIYAFQDKRNATDFDVYAHHLYADGSTTNGIFEHPVIIRGECSPNPFSVTATITFPGFAPQLFTEFRLSGLLGNNFSVPFEVSGNGITIARDNLAEGVYFYEIRMHENIISTGKLIITD